MKWFSGMRRSCDAGEVMLIWAAVCLLMPFLRGVLINAGWPALSDILFGYAPLFTLVLVCALFALTWMKKFRLDQAAASAVFIAASAAVFSFLLSLTGWWNDGASYFILRPADAFGSIMTLGLLPLHAGPDALIRFLPLGLGIGLLWEFRRLRVDTIRGILMPLGTYLVSALSLHCLSWIAALAALTRGTTLQSMDDVNRLLITLQSSGFWINNQLDRFMVPLGSQAQIGLVAVQAAVLFLLAAGFLLALMVRRVAAYRALAQRWLTLQGLGWFGICALGMGLGWSARGSDPSYTSLLAFGLAWIVFFVWILYWRLERDLDNLAEDEVSRPHLPLPSGAIALQDYQELSRVFLVVSWLGAALLGWPVFLGIFSATLLLWLQTRRGAGWGSGQVPHAVLSALIAFCLGYAAAAYGISAAQFQPWMIFLLAGSALLVGGADLIYRLRYQAAPLRIVHYLPAACLLLSLAVINQPLVWSIGFLAVLGQLGACWKSEKWLKYGALPAYILLCMIACLALMVPRFFVSF